MIVDNARRVNNPALERGLGLDLEPWLLEFSNKLQRQLDEGKQAIGISWSARAKLAACLRYPCLSGALRRLERQLAKVKRIRVQEHGGELCDLL